MAINNLYSLINSAWYVEPKYGEAHLPLLFNILSGHKIEIPTGKKQPEFGRMGIKGASMDESNTEEQFAAVVSIKSPIYKYNQECGPRGTKTHMRVLDQLKRNSQVAGVVLDIDSGGGQVYGTPEFHDFIKEYPKPVVVYTDGLLCSAAYYIAAGANHIVANKRAEAIGSIGAYAQFLDLKGYYEKQGAKLIEAYADQSTEKNKAVRELFSGNTKTYIKEQLNPIVDNFISDIKSTRNGVSEKVFKGATYPGPEALKLNLIDELGTLETAINKVFELSKNSNSNKSQNTMSKPQSFPNLEKVLGLETPLAETDNGSYLQGEQKTTIENALSANATALKNAQDAQAKAEADLKTAQEEKASVTTAKLTALKAVAKEAGVEDLADDADAEAVQTAITAKIQELNGKPGASHTTGAAEENEDEKYPYIDFNSSIYKTK